MKKKFFLVVAIFLVSFGFLGSSFSHPLMAYEIPKDDIKSTENKEQNYKQERGFTLTSILIWVAKVFGTAIISFISKIILNMGLRAACKRYNDYNDPWDYVCDSVNHYRD